MATVKRPYRSPLRAERAARTRAAIVEAARRLLVRDGLRQTTIEAIADAAGVSVQTVYAIYGSKAAILMALLDRLEVEAHADLMAAELAAAGSPRAQLRSIVAFNRRLFQRSSDVISMALGSAGVDPDVAAHVAAGRRRRRASQLPIVRGWHRQGALRQGLRSREAADVLWAFTSPEIYLLYVTHGGWSTERYEGWLVATLDTLLFTTAEHLPQGRPRR